MSGPCPELCSPVLCLDVSGPCPPLVLVLTAPLNSVARLLSSSCPCLGRPPELYPPLVLVLAAPGSVSGSCPCLGRGPELYGCALWPGSMSGRAVPKQLEAPGKYICVRFHQHGNFGVDADAEKNADAVWGLYWYKF